MLFIQFVQLSPFSFYLRAHLERMDFETWRYINIDRGPRSQ